MSPKDYVKNVLVTEAKNFTSLKERLSQERNIRLLHGGIGLSSELAELYTALYKDELDTINLKEEFGDFGWYLGIMVDELKLDPEDIFRPKEIALDEYDFSNKDQTLKILVDSITVNVGEIMDLLKKSIFYGKSLDQDQMKEKLKSMVSEINSSLKLYDITLEQAMERNIEKLRARYGEKFTEAAALERNLLKEREILEKPSVEEFAEEFMEENKDLFEKLAKHD